MKMNFGEKKDSVKTRRGIGHVSMCFHEEPGKRLNLRNDNENTWIINFFFIKILKSLFRTVSLTVSDNAESSLLLLEQVFQ